MKILKEEMKTEKEDTERERYTGWSLREGLPLYMFVGDSVTFQYVHIVFNLNNRVTGISIT